ncbi:hypothetical protein F5879DRAFT_989974 [Lentinula edodes]|uniref:uncharacterized protein n=1 Tax=Lentinula edodes TaxID=5353 RepID=UPI001E8EC293|nr:uncharacterized protein C8R40DRAFT_1170022 [Lentinula edodes]KAH7875896.1 hypothetical protein C8R40DRAFT_1170022 [Lentinula edodes]KAJ3903613.1 hypothetical protein F5879DRAFT_989974 [Lentinula edodes]KAJ3917511.1 hypothetical protein F5877DRAFT_68140 [Lentinula edodes]
MPAPAPFPSPFPALYLYPINDSFIPKHISLLHNTHVKIGRQTNAKTTPGERNGYFDSKVLSRQHAEVWEEGNKIFIKDVKSSNGTFINGERLSLEGLESDPYELKSDDNVEFGIDIIGEDNKTIVHHKVAARVMCILSEQDAQIAARAEQYQMQQMQQFAGPSSSLSPASNGSMINQTGPSSGPGSSNSASFNFSGQQPPRRPQMSQQGISGMGGMGGSMRPPGKSGLTFDHILNRLQGELQKSRETGAELHTLTGAMSDIHDTLGGGNLPTTAPPFPHALPPVRPPQSAAPPPSQPDVPSAPSTQDQQELMSNEPLTTSTTTTHFQMSSASSSALLVELQTQLKDTQTSLSQHIDKIRVLEDALKEQEAIRREVRLLRDMMDAVQRHDEPSQNTTSHKTRRQSNVEPQGGFDVDEEEETDNFDDEFEDDSRSVGTAVPHELERVDEEDEESASTADDESLPSQVDELDLEMAVREEARLQPSAPDGAFDGEFEDNEVEEEEQPQELGRPRTPEPSHLGMGTSRSKALNSPPKHSQGLSSTVVDELTTRLTTLSAQLESALALSSTLQAQHSTAQSTISALESKVEALESLVTATLSAQQRQPAVTTEEQTAPQRAERESLISMVVEWKKSVEGQWSNVQEEWNQERERLNRAREEWESKVRLVDDGLERMERMRNVALSKDTPLFHGNGDIKHGLVTPPSPRSLSSDSNRPRRKRSGSGRGRTGSKKRSLSRGAETDDTEATLANEEPHVFEKAASKLIASTQTNQHSELTSGSPLAVSEPSANPFAHSDHAEDSLVPARTTKAPSINDHNNRVNMQTAVGVLVLSVAAAAVIWRIKPDHV